MVSAGALLSGQGAVINASNTFVNLIAQSTARELSLPFTLEPDHCPLCRCILELLAGRQLNLNRQVTLNGLEYDIALKEALTDGDGNPVFWVVIEYVNTYRLQTQILEQAEQDANIGGWELDMATGMMRLSKQVFKIIALDDVADLPLERLLDLFSDPSKRQLRSLLESPSPAGHFDKVFDLRNGDGRRVKLRVTSYPVAESEGRVTTLRGAMQDVTLQWYEEERNKLAIDGANIGVWQMDHWSQRLTWSEAMYRIYGKEEDGPLTYDDWRRCIVPDDLPSTEKALTHSIARDIEFTNSFRIVHGKSGEVRHIKAIAKTYYDDHQKPLRSIGVNIDISQLKRQEDQLVLERTMQIQQAKLASIGEMAAGIGHEINNPLSVSLGNLELLKASLSKHGFMTAEVQGYIAKQFSGLERIRTIVGGMRRLIRKESEEDKTRFDVMELVSSCVELVAQIYAQDGVEVTMGVTDNSVVLGHYGELQQVLMNLLSNAKDAVAESQEKRIEVSIRQRSSEVSIAVKDRGVGMDKATQAKVFDNFFTLKPVTKGTGLGLSICERIVAEHQGRITLESELGSGTTVTVTLPVITTKASQSASSPAAREAVADDGVRFEGLRAIIVDDEPMMLQVLKAYLELMNITVFATTKASQAVSALKVNHYDLLLTDLCMPGTDGWQLIKDCKDSHGKSLRVIAMTGGTSVVNESINGVELKSDGILYKPFDQQSLKQAIAEVLDHDS